MGTSEEKEQPTTANPSKPDLSQVIKTPSKGKLKAEVPNSEAIAEEIQDNIILNEIARGYRVLDKSKWGPIRIYKDSKMFVAVAGDKAYTKERFALLKDSSVPSLVELTPLLAARGIWTPEQDKAIEDVSVEIGKLNEKLEKAKKETEKKGIELKRDEKLEAFWNLITIREQVFGESIETQSEIARRSEMMVIAVREHITDEEDHDKLRKIWNTSKDMLNEDSADFAWILRECQKYWTNQEVGGDAPLEESPEGNKSK